jgi:hypothetical protein
MGIAKNNKKGEWAVTVTIPHEAWKKLGLEEGQACKLQ